MSNNIEFWQMQKAANLTNSEAATLFAVSKRNIERWRVNSPTAPKAVLLCLQSIVSGEPVNPSCK